MARQWLSEYHFERQRKISPQAVKRYAFDMARGHFLTTELRLIHVGDKIYLTQGQHRLNAVVAANVPVKFNVYHRIDAAPSGVHEDYGTQDTGYIRNFQAIFGATDIPSESGLVPIKFERLNSALGPIIGGFQPSAYASNNLPYLRSFQVRSRALRDWIPYGRQYFDAVSGAEAGLGPKFLRQSVVAVGVVTFRYQPEKALEFWEAVAHNDGLRAGDPRRTLHFYLLNNGLRRVTSPAYSRAVAAAWNSWMGDRTNLQLKVYDATKPILIIGTPYDGRTVKIETYDDVNNVNSENLFFQM